MPQLMKFWIPLLNVALLIATIVINGMSNSGLVEGQTVGGVSQTFNTLFAPSGITFAIWGVIYLALLAFGGYQIREAFMDHPYRTTSAEAIGPWFMLSSVCNIVWIFLWLNEKPGFALLAMLGLLASLIVIYVRIDAVKADLPRGAYWFVTLPFSLYLGWISVATVANVSAWLVGISWAGAGISPFAWTVLMVVIATLLGIVAAGGFRDFPFGAVIMWALLGIWLKHRDLGASESGWVQVAALAGIIGIGVSIATQLIFNGFKIDS